MPNQTYEPKRAVPYLLMAHNAYPNSKKPPAKGSTIFEAAYENADFLRTRLVLLSFAAELLLKATIEKERGTPGTIHGHNLKKLYKKLSGEMKAKIDNHTQKVKDDDLHYMHVDGNHQTTVSRFKDAFAKLRYSDSDQDEFVKNFTAATLDIQLLCDSLLLEHGITDCSRSDRETLFGRTSEVTSPLNPQP